MFHRWNASIFTSIEGVMPSTMPIEKILGQYQEKISVFLKSWNFDSKYKIHPCSIYQPASSQQMLVQASMEDYMLGYLGKIEFETLLGPIDNNVEFLSLSGLWSKKSKALKNHCAFATNAFQNSGKFGLLQFDCNFGFWRIRHILLLLICIQG